MKILNRYKQPRIMNLKIICGNGMEQETKILRYVHDKKQTPRKRNSTGFRYPFFVY